MKLHEHLVFFPGLKDDTFLPRCEGFSTWGKGLGGQLLGAMFLRSLRGTVGAGGGSRNGWAFFWDIWGFPLVSMVMGVPQKRMVKENPSGCWSPFSHPEWMVVFERFFSVALKPHQCQRRSDYSCGEISALEPKWSWNLGHSKIDLLQGDHFEWTPGKTWGICVRTRIPTSVKLLIGIWGSPKFATTDRLQQLRCQEVYLQWERRVDTFWTSILRRTLGGFGRDGVPWTDGTCFPCG